MQVSILLAAALGASSIAAAPTWPQVNINSAMTDGIETVSEYFNMLAQKVQAGKDMMVAPVCDLSQAVLPQPPSPLDAVTSGLVLKHVAIGRGTQNYTCDVTNATAEPVAAGAVATLFNASCVASSYPDLLHQLPKLALHFNLSSTEQLQLGSGSDWEQKLGPTNLGISGHHFFTNATTPFFTLDTSRAALGTIPCNKTGTTNAPGTAPTGQQGEGAVAWLKLQARSGATGNLQEVYRVETAGGSAPKSCSGLPAAFEIQYAAEYWFYEHAASES
ncbi:putative malate dehydrogenase protein [Eutypa lata UCREL1]|uniref:Putative malate dehydrogenase protein n=1 Tax=Eutypa lata (strain UCR-EL1) TaxID=1287681 RepID=M7T0P6_EUTLA|nr:putative malate dehydrogenase protein [Eutypa lata UCREL1]